MNQIMKNYILSIPIAVILFILSAQSLFAQGCVAVRHFSSGSMSGQNTMLAPGDWTVSSNYRYFRSFRHFKGTEEEPDRVANHTEVINYSHALDLNLSYAFNERLYANMTLPFVYNERSSLYEHGRTERHMSYSQGIADIRVGAGYWLLSPEKGTKGNVALGLGIKLPTGNYNAKDEFYNVGPEGETEVRPVDQSIQPGDGGVGATVDFQAFRLLTDHFSVYADGFYLINPRETNGTRTFRETLNPLLANESIMSVPDQYALRAGFAYTTPLHGLGFSLGGRLEGVPVRDLIGGSEGFRRPGYILSVEPGINYMSNNFTVSLNVPVAIVRNRQQSVTDKEMEKLTGQPRHGDAAFADYLINVGVAWRISKNVKSQEFKFFEE